MAFLLLATVTLGSGLFATRAWGHSPWRWLVIPQVMLALLASVAAYLGQVPLWLVRWPYADKVLHFVLFGFAVFGLNLWLGGRRMKLGRWSVAPAIAVLLIAASLEELLQGFSPNRTLDVWDWLSNVAGIFFFWWLSEKLLTRRGMERR
ncbi:MAG: VanZ family protein [Anaerolineales bacterium]